MIFIENLLHSFQLFFFHLWPIYSLYLSYFSIVILYYSILLHSSIYYSFYYSLSATKLTNSCTKTVTKIIIYFSIILCEISLFYSVTTIGSMDAPYFSSFLTTCFVSLSHCHVFDFYIHCIHLLVLLHCPVFTYWNTGFLVKLNAII
jgi:hypothetical protein